MSAMRNARAGFTLLELLGVLAILAILATVLLTTFGKQTEAVKRKLAETQLASIGAAISSYESERGAYPVSRFDAAWGTVPNATNIGGEALVVALFSKDAPIPPGIKEDEVVNTDGDHASKKGLTRLSDELYELRDPWENPIAYFNRQDYERTDAYATFGADGEPLDSSIRARKNPRTQQHYNPHGFQLISAGPDSLFGTEDDVHNFKVE